MELKPPTFGHFKSLLMLKSAPANEDLEPIIWERTPEMAPRGMIEELLVLEENDFVMHGMSPEHARTCEEQFGARDG